MDVGLLNGNVLTYIGDSYYEHQVRVYLVKEGLTKLNNLHQEAVKYTSGKAQAMAIKYLLEIDYLTNEEINIYKRGRNVSAGSKRNLNIVEIQNSNGFEALIGYLSLKDKARANILIKKTIHYLKRRDEKQR